MKYEHGDKVKIRTWEQMEKEFFVDLDGDINMEGEFYFLRQEEKLNQECPDRIVTIKKMSDTDRYYHIEEIKWSWTDEMKEWLWTDEMIEGLAEEPEPLIPINNRFEIMDL